MSEVHSKIVDHHSSEQMHPSLREPADMKGELVKLLTALRNDDKQQLLVSEQLRSWASTPLICSGSLLLRKRGSQQGGRKEMDLRTIPEQWSTVPEDDFVACEDLKDRMKIVGKSI
ncbi:hypothetical protein BLNAU_13976 [Blattamonas nauphoetae]|uniref:Uncharacterized protein n=1 Tax=Blattamonas nauphoetae TaxID=2049346 RepID=A0ABQ9XF99_9EUKA|nr:hypothetical protein BLNAU_13976 [Blattamonas nauphoetae]